MAAIGRTRGLMDAAAARALSRRSVFSGDAAGSLRAGGLELAIAVLALRTLERLLVLVVAAEEPQPCPAGPLTELRRAVAIPRIWARRRVLLAQRPVDLGGTVVGHDGSEILLRPVRPQARLE